MSVLKITETILRDAQQSLIATRMTTEEMLPALSLLDKVGYYSIEAWGGATFDSCLRFLNEDPWQRLRKIRDGLKNTKIQMLFRGQNILGYRHYADDVVEYFVKKSVSNGVDVVRVFDALNDCRNLLTAVKAAKQEKAIVETAICYTSSPFHSDEKFVELARELEDLGSDMICVKDMSGLLKPYSAYELFKRLKEEISIPIRFHTHYTSGLASMSYLKAIEAGANGIDTSLSPLALGTSQAATECIVSALKDTEYDTGIDLNVFKELTKYFSNLRESYIKRGLLHPKMLSVDVNTLHYQVPGGMLSNLFSQLKEQGKEDRFEDVLNEIPRVRRDLGYIPLVTPTSQIVGTQALLNVISGERYKMVAKETRNIAKGLYGRTPVRMENEVLEKLIGYETVISVRPADLIPPELPKLREEVKEYTEQEEDVLTYALFGVVAINFFKNREAEKYKIETGSVNFEDATHPV